MNDYPLPRLSLISLALLCYLAAFGFLFHDVIIKLVHDWATDSNYSHGFLIVPIALYLAWERRDQLAHAPLESSSLGLIPLIGSLTLLITGVLGSELFITRIALIGMIAGSILFILGWKPSDYPQIPTYC